MWLVGDSSRAGNSSTTRSSSGEVRMTNDGVFFLAVYFSRGTLPKTKKGALLGDLDHVLTELPSSLAPSSKGKLDTPSPVAPFRQLEILADLPSRRLTWGPKPPLGF